MADRHRFGRVGVACAMVVLGVALSAQDTLRYKWKAGDTNRYRIEQQTTVNMSGIPGIGDMAITTTMMQVLAMTAKDVATSGTATLEGRIESMRMDLASAMMNMSYDSTKPAPTDPMGAQIAQSIAPMLNAPFTMVVTSLGTLEKVEGFSAILQKSAAAGPQMPGMPGLDSMFGDDAIKALFGGQGFAALPSGPVKAGETWRQQVTIPNPLGAMTATLVNTARGPDALDGRTLTKFTTATTLKPSGAPGAMPGGLPMTVTLGEGGGDAETWFDTAAGRVVRSTGTSTLPMSMSMNAPDGSSISLQASTVTKTTMSLIEK